jgi:L-histidine N-alpha-methyltransferase
MMARNSGMTVSEERFTVHNLVSSASTRDFADDVREGLLSERKHLFPKYLYDPLGSQLFDAICLLPEYYLTRSEDEILATYADEITSVIPGRKVLLEMGSGSASKTRLLIEALLRRQRSLVYVPVDISATALENSSRVLLQSYPEIEIQAYAGDYYAAIERLRGELSGPTLALFLGSNIGNFDETEALGFLRAMRSMLNRGDGLLLGADLKKDRATLEAAYDDPLGVTAAFSRNLLVRMNRELGAGFDVHSFKHVAIYNEAEGRIEIYIESLKDQVVDIKGLSIKVKFKQGERIHTENSYKYDPAQLSRLAERAGFVIERSWTDRKGMFSSNLLVAAG